MQNDQESLDKEQKKVWKALLLSEEKAKKKKLEHDGSESFVLPVSNLLKAAAHPYVPELLIRCPLPNIISC